VINNNNTDIVLSECFLFMLLVLWYFCLGFCVAVGCSFVYISQVISWEGWVLCISHLPLKSITCSSPFFTSCNIAWWWL